MKPIVLLGWLGLAAVATSAAAQEAGPDLWMSELRREGGALRAGAPVNLTARDGYDNQPWFLPSGDGLLYVAEHEGQTDVYRYDLRTRTSTQVTRTPEWREYSPTLSADGGELRLVRWDRPVANGELWRYSAAGEPQGPIRGGVAQVGYYAFADTATLALFVNDSVRSFVVADVRTGRPDTVTTGIGGSAPTRVPGTDAVSVLTRDQGDWWITRFDRRTRAFRPLTPALPGSTSYAWTRRGTVLMGLESTLYEWDPKVGPGWTPVGRFPEVRNISRITLNPAEDRVVFVAEPAPTARPSSASATAPPIDFPRATPASVGLSAERLAQATRVLQSHVDAGDVAGVVAAVVRDGKLVYLEALGHRDLESASPMPADALFRVYSMTRPVTSLGILMLHDQGLLDVSHPVQRYLPEFAGQAVLRDPASTAAADTRPRVGDVTLAQLLTHTSGIGSRSSAPYRARDVHGWDRPLDRVVRDVAAAPLFEDPGTRYRYGMSAEILGRVIEVVSGMPVEDFLRRRVLDPLGMTDSGFFVDGTRAARLATVYRRAPEGGLRAIEMETIPVTERRALVSSGVGLVSSTMDFLRFSQFILDGGVVGGRRLIGPETARMISANAVPDALLPIGDQGYWAGSGWSLGGFAVALDPSAYDHPVSPGEFWWDGSAGTRFWIDPQQNMITVVMAQVSPAGGNGFRERFKQAVYGAIEDQRAGR